METHAVGKKPQRQMKLALFLTGDGNYHMAGWRLPGSTNDAGQNIQRWFEAAQTIERCKLHMLFIADAASPPGTDDLETLSLTARIDRMDPIPILSAVSVVTKNLGLAATMSATYLEPYNLARTMASLDHVSGGRAAWNIVTGSNKDDALQFSREFTRRMASVTSARKNSSMSCAESGTAMTMTPSRATRNRASICVPTRCISLITKVNTSRYAAPRPFRARRKATPCLFRPVRRNPA